MDYLQDLLGTRPQGEEKSHSQIRIGAFAPMHRFLAKVVVTNFWPQAIKVSLLSKRPLFFMLLWWGHLFVCTGTFCTLCSRFVMRWTPVYPLGVWSLKSVFSLWLIFQILSPNRGFQILLENKLSWSPMLSCGMRVKAKFFSLHQFKLTPQLLHHHHRMCLLPSTLKLLLLSLCLPWELSSGKSILLESVSSRVKSTYGSA